MELGNGGAAVLGHPAVRINASADGSHQPRGAGFSVAGEISSDGEARMAIDVRQKASNICSDLMAGADSFMKALEFLLNTKGEKEGTGIDLTSAEVEGELDLPNNALLHADGTDFNNVMASAAAVKAWMDSNGHTGVFHKVRP